MKTLILSLITTLLFSSYSFASRFGEALPAGFKILNSEDPEQKQYFEIKKQAINYIREGSRKISESGKRTFSRGDGQIDIDASVGEAAINKLLMAKFAVSTNHLSAGMCGNSDFFVLPTSPGIIFVCDGIRDLVRTRGHEVMVKKTLSQSVIHETGHWIITKRDNECAPTVFQLEITRHVLPPEEISTASRDAYENECPGAFDDYRYIASKTGLETGKKLVSQAGSNNFNRTTKSAR